MTGTFELLQVCDDKLAEAGLVCDHLETDGKLHRCGVTDKPRGLDGAYVIHFDDNPLIFVLNWKTSFQEVFPFKDVSKMSNAERMTFWQRARELKTWAEAERRKRQARAARQALKLLEMAHEPDPRFEYLAKMQLVAPLGVKQKNGRLYVPVYDENGKVQSLQTIDQKGVKRFLKDGRTKCGHFRIRAADGREDGPVLVCEGVRTGVALHMATGLEVWIAFSAHNLLDVALLVHKLFPKRKACVCADSDRGTEHKLAEKFGKDKATNPGVKAATEAAEAIGACLAICPALSDLPQNDDFADLYAWQEGPAVKAVIDQALGSSSQGGIVCYDLSEYCALEIEPIEYLLHPVIAKDSLTMLFAESGLGKTHLAMTLGQAIATGSTTLRGWKAEKPRRVLYIDGEMPAPLMHTLAKEIQNMFDRKAEPGFFRLIPYGSQEKDRELPNLGTKEGQERIEPFLEGVDLLILDNLLTLVQTGKSNDSDAWLPVQDWLSNLRRRGISVLYLHHAGKNGSQLGTIRKEINLDLKIELKKPEDYSSIQGSRFELYFSKSRVCYGEDARPFEAQYSTDEYGKPTWIIKNLETIEEEIINLLKQGISQEQIVKDLGLSSRKIVRTVKERYENRTGDFFPRSKKRKANNYE